MRGVGLRPSEDDREFLYTLHCTAMRPWVEATWGWDDEHRFFMRHA